MSATSLSFLVTDAVTGDTIELSSINLVLVTSTVNGISGANATILYDGKLEVPQTFNVTQTPAAISAASNYLIPLTNTSTSVVFYVNPDKIVDFLANGSGSSVYYNALWAENQLYVVNETPTAIASLISSVVSSGGGGGQVNQVAAHAGGGQGSATALAYGYNEIITVTTALDSVKLPAGVIGARVTVLNKGANIANIFPVTGGTINGGAANAAIPIAPGVQLSFTNIDGIDWESSSQVVALQDGTVGAPSLTFEDNANTGLYRIGANEIGISANGAKVLDIATTGLAVTGTLSSTSDLSVNTNKFIVTASTGATSVAGLLSPAAAINNSSGTVGAPAYSYTGQTDMGLYKISATQNGSAVGGVLVGGWNSSGLFTDVISNQTANGGTSIKVPVVPGTAFASPTVLTATQSGSILLGNAIDGNVFTLPAATAANTGVRFKLIQTATVTSNSITVQGATSSDLFIAGSNVFQTKATTDGVYYSPNGTTNYKYSGNGSTTGGLIGDVVEFICLGLNQWLVNGTQQATGTVATPFAG